MKTSPRALATLTGSLAASLIAATLAPASALAAPLHSQLALPLSVLSTNDGGSGGADADSTDTTGQDSSGPAQPPANEGAATQDPDSTLRSEDADSVTEERAIASSVQHGVPVPDPLNFAAITAEADNYLMPASADRFKNADGTYTIGRPTPGGPAAGATTAGLEEFYSQKIEWGPCAPFAPDGKSYSVDDAECGYLIVPLNYDQPQGPTIAIGLLKVPAREPDKRIGTIFTDPGGPGASGMASALSALKATGVVRDRFDYIGFDPRGVSSSLPMIRCQSSHAFDIQRQGSDLLSANQKNSVLEYNTQECYTNTGKGFTGINGKSFIDNVGTRNVIRDLDVARAAVGDPKINYLGYSYGTSIGYQYAMEFPDNIRAMILDGVVNPFENNAEEAKKYEDYTANTSQGLSSELAQLQGFQSTFKQFLTTCAANDGFDLGGEEIPCAVGTSDNLDELMANYQAIAQKAWGATTYATTETTPRPVSFKDLTQGTIQAMYDEGNWPFLNMALNELKEHNTGDIIMLLADAYYERDDEGKYSFFNPAFQSIWCTDAGTPEGANELAAARKRLEDQYAIAPFVDPGKNPDGTQRGLEPEADWCTYYSTQQTLPKGKSLTAMPNILVVSTTYDPATPYQDGVIAAHALGGTLLTVAANTHCSYTAGAGDCAAEVGDRYFVDLVVPTDQTGETNVSTKDIFSNVITANECQIHSFRPQTAIAPASGAAGTTVPVTVSGLVRNTDYQLTLPAGYTLASIVKANTEGIASFSVTIPANATPGEVKVSVSPADLSANDPAVTAEGVLTIVAPSPSTDSTQQGNGNTPGVTHEPSGADNATGRSDQKAAASQGKKKGASLASTGTTASAAMLLVLMLLAGAASVRVLSRH